MNENINDRWSKHQLIHAVSIIIYYHMLACFCTSIGLLPEIDQHNKELLTDVRVVESEAEAPKES